MQIPVVRNVLEANEKIAASVREKLRERKILALNLISSPGAGKTTLLERTLHDLAGEFRMAVIEGDLQTDNDARRVAATGAQAVQINTDGGCHLDSNMIMTAMESLDLDGVDILFIENVGNLVCPVEFDCGEDAKVAVRKLEKVHVFGNDYPTPDGTGVRDYIHVVDLARGHVCAIKKLQTNCGLFICNLGTGHGYSVLDVIHAFEKACGKPIPYVIDARRPGDIAECYADPTKAKNELGWVAEYGIEEMCADSWNWQKKNPDGYHTAN